MAAFRHREYSPAAAWRRAVVYFAVCLLASHFAGVLRALFSEPIVREEQLADPVWWYASGLVTAWTLFAYLFFWPRGTATLGRPRRVFAATVFGFLWGFCQAQLMLAVYTLIQALALAPPARVGLMLLLWSVFAALWQSAYWDIRVAPEHNIPEWNLRKVLVAHIPFLLLSVGHYELFGNAALFVAWNVIALVASALAMHFPAPGDRPSVGHA